MDAFFKESGKSLTGQHWGPVDSIAPVRLEDLSAPEESEPSTGRRVRALDVLVGTAGVAALVVLAVFVAKGMPHEGAAHGATPVATATAPPPKPLVHPPPKVAEASKPGEVASAAPALSSVTAAPEATTALAAAVPPVASGAAPASPEPSAAPPPKPRRKKMPKDHTPPTASFPD